jgi:hypothetical protein
MAVSYMKRELLTLREYTLVFCGVRDSMLLTLREYTPVFGGVRDSVLLISLVFCVVFLVKHNTERKRDEQHRVTDPTKNTTQKTKEKSNTESRTPPKTQHRKLKRWATRSHGTPPKTGDEQHGVTDPTKNTTQKNKEISNTQSRTPPKIQHRKQKRWATQSHGPHQKHNTEN